METAYLWALACTLGVGSVAVGGLAGVRVMVQRNAEVYRQRYVINFPRDLEFAAVVSFVRSLSGIGGSQWARLNGIPAVTFEIYADEKGIQHHLVVPSRQAAFVIGQLRGHLPGVNVTVDPTDEAETVWTEAVEIGMNTGRVPLKVPIPESIITTLLSSLLPLGPGQSVLFQWIATSAVSQEAVGEPESWEKHLFHISGRLAAKAETRDDARRLIRRLFLALSHLRGFGITVRPSPIPSKLIQSRVTRRSYNFMHTCKVYATELATLIAFPAGAKNIPGLPDGMSRQLAASTQIPREGFIIGVSNYPGAEQPLAVSPDDALKHIWYSGPSGVGKSTSLCNLCIQIMEQGYGMLLIEPGKGLVDDVLNAVPESRQNDVTLFDPSDINYPIGLNILTGSDPERITGHIVSLFHSIYSESWGPRLEYILRYAVLTAALKGLSLYDVKQLLTNPSFRRGLMRSIKNPDIREFWQRYESQPDNAADSVINKLDAFLGYTVIRNIVGQPVSAFDMGSVIKEGKIVMAPLSPGLVGDANSQMLGSLLVSLAWQAARARAGIPQAERKPFFFVVDEFQNYLNLPVAFNEAFAQARGYGIGLIVANQSPTQLKPDVKHALMVNVGNKVAFRQSHDDAKTFASEFAPYLSSTDLQGLGRYEAVVKLMSGNQTVPPATATMPPPPRPTGSSWAVRSASRAKYGRSVTEVEREFAQRFKALSEPQRKPKFGVVEDGSPDV